jgi:hypothetical protein
MDAVSVLETICFRFVTFVTHIVLQNRMKGGTFNFVFSFLNYECRHKTGWLRHFNGRSPQCVTDFGKY